MATAQVYGHLQFWACQQGCSSCMGPVQVGPVLEAMEDILAALLRSLDGRVYVAVGRGLWDFTSKDIYDYVDSLQEGKENKVSSCKRQNL